MSASSLPEGSLCHTEIYAEDLQKTMKFYHELFGWEVFSTMDNYGMWKDRAGAEGGFSTNGKPNDTGCTLYLKVDNMESFLAKLKGKGMEIIRGKTEISPEYGYMAIFKDPSGNSIGLWSKS